MIHATLLRLAYKECNCLFSQVAPRSSSSRRRAVLECRHRWTLYIMPPLPRKSNQSRFPLPSSGDPYTHICCIVSGAKLRIVNTAMAVGARIMSARSEASVSRHMICVDVIVLSPRRYGTTQPSVCASPAFTSRWNRLLPKASKSCRACILYPMLSNRLSAPTQSAVRALR